MSLANCRVVLVRTQTAGNLGATARVMRNFSLSQLTLVAPQADRTSEEARKLSTHGEDILNQARIVATLEEALADCVVVAATSARLGGLFRKQTLGTPETVMPHLIDAAGPVALVFGPEPSGLTNEEISICNYLITIPADPSYPALNLAQAVAVCLYELHRAGLARTAPPAEREPIAPFADQERMFGELRAALEQIHFLYGAKADSLFHALRHLIGRAGPTAMEVNVLLGLARQMVWWVERRRTEE